MGTSVYPTTFTINASEPGHALNVQVPKLNAPAIGGAVVNGVKTFNSANYYAYDEGSAELECVDDTYATLEALVKARTAVAVVAADSLDSWEGNAILTSLSKPAHNLENPSANIKCTVTFQPTGDAEGDAS